MHYFNEQILYMFEGPSFKLVCTMDSGKSLEVSSSDSRDDFDEEQDI